MSEADITELAIVMFSIGLCAALFLWPYLMRFK